jgi:GH15 family glucan-1,4-alpha-glucosidase
VLRSLIVLNAMTAETTGAVIAAPTTSLPEDIGGVRNWDSRYCWLRDTVLALKALLATGYSDAAIAFRNFMLRVGLATLAAEVMAGSTSGSGRGWRTAIEYVETIWREPDDGIWETRGPRRPFTHSRVMAWVVFDRAVRLAERFELDAPLERWKQARDEIHREVCERGYDPERRTFTQYYGSTELDASVLNIALVGFLPAGNERVAGTIDAISSELGRDGLVSRYSTSETDEGLAGDEGQFLACSFWLASASRVTAASSRRVPCSSG